MTPYIRIQQDDFSQDYEYKQLAVGAQAGAVVTFVGRVRDFDGTESGKASNFWLEHYPGMTEQVLAQIITQAEERWPILGVRVIHRVGEMLPCDQIVFVGVSSKHRSAAFAACEFVMDYLKTEAPFWKKEGTHWVDAKESDTKAAKRWKRQP